MGHTCYQLREMCETYCQTMLHNVPDIADDEERERLADKLLTDFAASCHPQTTGLDAISVAIVCD